MTNYQTSVGMECHAELLTQSKMFSACPNAFGGDPNTRTDAVTLGLPGTLPVINKEAVELVMKAALALNCEISPLTIFHRKHYFYPDLPKGYQISQYGDTPIGVNGFLEIEKADGTRKKIHITRVHLEEDTGKSIHSEGLGYSVMDYNRAGVPLMEIVTAFPPDIESAEEATLYAESLRSILVYLGVTDGKMEQGSLRVEPNISVRPEGSETFGIKTELKNLNSFRSVERGVTFEAKRQSEILEQGGSVIQATYGWDDEKGVSVLQRVKEVEQEYRYFPDPDLLPVTLSAEYVETVRAGLPELPLAKKRRLMEEYGLPAQDAALLTAERAVADFYEAACQTASDKKSVANWLLGDLMRLANNAGTPVYQTRVSAPYLADLVGLIEKKTITGTIGKAVLEAMFASGKNPEIIIKEQGLTVSGADEVAQMVARVVAANPEVVAKIKAGADKSKGFLVGQIMKEAKGRARPDDVNRLLEAELGKA